MCRAGTDARRPSSSTAECAREPGLRRSAAGQAICLDVQGAARQADRVASATPLDEFARRGVVLLHDVFSPEEAEAMRDVVWRDLYYTDGVRRDDPSTWRRSSPRRALHRAKRHPIFQKMLGEPVRDLADALLGRGWSVSGGFGNLLVDFQDAERWHLPGRDGHWHLDMGWEGDPGRLVALRLFGLFGEVPPRGGGTLLVGGSQHLVERHLRQEPGATTEGLKVSQASASLFRSHPWLSELTLADRPAEVDEAYDADRRRRFMDVATDIDGWPAQVLEACGGPGDVYVCHPWTIHCRPPIAAAGPRLLRSPSLFADLG